MAVYRRTSRSRYILALLVLTAATLITLSARGSSGGALGGVRTAARDVITPLQRATHAALAPVGNFLSGSVNYGSLRAQNQRLRAEVTHLQAQAATAQAEQAAAQQVLANEHLKFVGQIPTVAARVIDRGSANFENSLTIGKGRHDGIAVGEPVVSSGGLVGTISQAGPTTATVELLTDPSFAVGVRLDKANTGSAQGFGQGHVMRVTIDTPQAPPPKLTKGAAIVTSGLSLEKFPAGIPVGTVASAAVPTGSTEPAITLKPLVNLDQLSYVQVLIWSAQ